MQPLRDVVDAKRFPVTAALHAYTAAALLLHDPAGDAVDDAAADDVDEFAAAVGGARGPAAAMAPHAYDDDDDGGDDDDDDDGPRAADGDDEHGGDGVVGAAALVVADGDGGAAAVVAAATTSVPSSTTGPPPTTTAADALGRVVHDLRDVHAHVRATTDHIAALCREREQLLHWLTGLQRSHALYADARAQHAARCAAIDADHRARVAQYQQQLHTWRLQRMGGGGGAGAGGNTTTSTAARGGGGGGGGGGDADDEEDDPPSSIVFERAPDIPLPAASPHRGRSGRPPPAAHPAADSRGAAAVPAFGDAMGRAAAATDGAVTVIGLTLQQILDQAKSVRAANTDVASDSVVARAVAKAAIAAKAKGSAAAGASAGASAPAAAARRSIGPAAQQQQQQQQQKPVYGNPSSFSGSLRKSSAPVPPPRGRSPASFKPVAAAPPPAAAAARTQPAAAIGASGAKPPAAATQAAPKPALRSVQPPQLAEPQPPAEPDYPAPPQPPVMPAFKVPSAYVAVGQRFVRAWQQLHNAAAADTVPSAEHRAFLTALSTIAAADEAEAGGAEYDDDDDDDARAYAEASLTAVMMDDATRFVTAAASVAPSAVAPDGGETTAAVDAMGAPVLLHPYAQWCERVDHALHTTPPALAVPPPSIAPPVGPSKGGVQQPVAAAVTPAQRLRDALEFEGDKARVAAHDVLRDVWTRTGAHLKQAIALLPQRAQQQPALPKGVHGRGYVPPVVVYEKALLRLIGLHDALLLPGTAAAGADEHDAAAAAALGPVRRAPTFVRRSA